MARLLLSCDDYIFHHDGKFYFKNQEWKEFYDRYLRVFEHLRICNRVVEESELKNSRIPIEDSRIEIVSLPEFHGPQQYLRVYWKLGKAMRHAVNGCDAAILRLPSTVAQRLSRQVIKSGIPYATEIVFDAQDGSETADNAAEKLLWRIIDRQMRKICAQADGVACVTEHYLQQHYYSRKTDHFTSHYSTLALSPSFFSSARTYPQKQVLSIAHVDMQIDLHGRKGTDTLILALSLLKREGVVINVEFAGEDRDGSKKKILDFAQKNGVGGQVQCTGFLSRQQLSQLLDEVDLFVLPTKAEGLPRVIIEAMAKGLPVVTTPASGNPELIDKEYLVGFNDVQRFAERIKALVSKPAEYEAQSKQNFSRSLAYEAHALQTRRDAFYQNLKSKIR